MPMYHAMQALVYIKGHLVETDLNNSIKKLLIVRFPRKLGLYNSAWYIVEYTFKRLYYNGRDNICNRAYNINVQEIL